MTPIATTGLFSRNAGLISLEAQERLANACIAIGGCGGDGGLLAERLARFGVGRLILADPDRFEPANTNRQFAASTRTWGRNKAEVVAEEIRAIHPSVEVVVHTDGITAGNVEGIVTAADIVVDEIEFSLPAVSVALHREARRQGKFTHMGANIGWGASTFCFAPDGHTFEEFFSYDEQAGAIDPLAYVPFQPAFISDVLLADVLQGRMPVPGLSSAVALVAAVISTDIILQLTGLRQPLLAPQFRSIDLFASTITTHTR